MLLEIAEYSNPSMNIPSENKDIEVIPINRNITIK
tara:strand:- start:3974 stop:4078 length:105 start_codon:yes stop_codon:yes gene_type:complete